MATADDDRCRLDRFLARQLPAYSRARLQDWIKAGHLRLDGAVVVDPSWRVKSGNAVAIEIPPARPSDLEATTLPLDILFEDDDLIVLEKPAGLVVHPAPGHDTGTLVHALLGHAAGRLSGIGGVERPGIVHRLDKAVSGVMVVAKTDASHRGLAGQFSVHSIERVYEAIVVGLAPDTARLDGAIGRHPTDRKRMAVVSRGGKPAVTHVQRLEAVGTLASRVACRLETGRTHQIRVHLSHHGHSILGDTVYAGNRTRSLPASIRGWLSAWGRIALHARVLGFVHPRTGAPLRFERSPPAGFATLMESLRACNLCS